MLLWGEQGGEDRQAVWQSVPAEVTRPPSAAMSAKWGPIPARHDAAIGQ